MTHAHVMTINADMLGLLRCPGTGSNLHSQGGALINADGSKRYDVTPEGITLFAEEFISPQGRAQQAHYDKIADAYVTNLGYPHTQEYMKYLDGSLFQAIDGGSLGSVAEICCGHGEAFSLLGPRVEKGIGVDVSLSMLKEARRVHTSERFLFVQGDATLLPLASDSFDNVFMLGGVHHVSQRAQLFAEIHRILKPGGNFVFREPVSDFLPWRLIRKVIYRYSPTLDHTTERPLQWEETVPVLETVGLRKRLWKTYGFLGFCFFMNSDVLVFNRLFRFIPGIRAITRAAARFDDWTVRLPGLSSAGLQVVGVAQKPGIRQDTFAGHQIR